MPRLGGGGGSPAPRRVVRRKPQAPSAAQVNAATNPQPVRTKPVPPAGPSPRQVRQARVQRQQIVSSERSVGTQARQQRRQAQARQRVRVAKANRQQIVSSERAVGAAARFADRQQRFVNPTPAGPLHDIVQAITHPAGTKAEQRILAPRIKAYQAHVHEEKVARVAPVLKTLNQLSRGYHASAGAADELVKGHGLKGALRGAEQGALHLKHAKSYSDVLKDAGVKNKTIRSIGGFVGDVALDPSTYLTAGAGSVALKAGEKEAAHAASDAASRDVKGLKVKVGGREVPGVRKATAHASRPVRAAARKTVPERVRHSVRTKVADANPDVAPVGATREATRQVNQATRAARAKASHGVHMGQQVGLGIRKKIGEKNYSRVIDAIEANDIRGLPADLRQYATHVHGLLKDIHERETAAGIKQGEITDRPQVAVPVVTAKPQETAKALSKAKRSVYAAERGLERAKDRAGVHQGRAEVLSRNVGGVRAEKMAERAGRAGPPPGYVRLYRGEGILKHTGEDWHDAPGGGLSHGRWFTTDPERAARYASGGGLRKGYRSYVDVPQHVADASQIHIPNHPPAFVLAKGWAARAVEDVPGARAAAVAEHEQRTAAMAKTPEIAARRRAVRAKLTGEEPRYAAGGHGVRETQLALQNARHQLTKARAAHEAASVTHESEKTLAAAQRKARDEAVKVNAKRAAAAKGYIPHVLELHIAEAEGKVGRFGRGGVGRMTVRPASSMAREEIRPLAELRKEMPGRYKENLAEIVADRLATGHTAIARAELNKELAATGREFKEGVAYNSEHEAVFHIVGKDIKEIKGHSEAEKMLADGHEGKLVILNRKLAERAFKEGSPTLAEKGIVHGYDRLQAGFKRTATFTPGFHVRNIIGDLSNSYLRQGVHKMLPGATGQGNLIRAGRLLKAYGRQEKALKDLTPAQVGKATLKTKRYGNVTYDEVAKNLREEGAFRSGYIARELPELEHSGMQTEAKLKKVRLPEKAKRVALAREDLPRLVTAMQALREGATYREAAQRVADLHFDYQHLTNFERTVMRRILPFYTWSARNIPLQAKTLITNPGKYAHIEALREEAQKATGAGQQDRQVVGLYKQLQAAGVKLPSGWEKYISRYEQQNAGIPINWKGHKFTLSAGLPFTDLGYLPGVAGAGDFGDRAAQLLTPLIKDPVEFGINYSFFFHDQIERDHSPLVAAPSLVGSWPAWAKKKFGVVKMIDSKSGKKVWAWPGKADYVAHAVPGLANTALQLMTPGGRTGGGLGGTLVSASGVKATPIDPIKNAMNLAYQRQAEIQKEQAKLNQQGITAKNPTPRYTLLSKQLKIVEQIAYQAKQAQGYKKLPRAGAPLKGRSGGGGSSGDFPSSSSGSYFPESDSGGFFPGS